MFGVPGPTEFDVRFRIFGIPVRVHPFFWIATMLLNWSLAEIGGAVLLLWVACVFVSILAHELGHALVARHYGVQHPEIWLYMLGGLTVYQNESQRPGQRLLVLIMGPGAGFILLGFVVAFAYFAYGITPVDFWERSLGSVPSKYMAFALYFLFVINLFFGLLNLLPVIPLDGGQISEILLTLHNRRQGRRRAYILSLVAAGLAAIYFFQGENHFMAILFAVCGFQSYQMLQMLHQQAQFGEPYEDDADWWKR